MNQSIMNNEELKTKEDSTMKLMDYNTKMDLLKVMETGATVAEREDAYKKWATAQVDLAKWQLEMEETKLEAILLDGRYLHPDVLNKEFKAAYGIIRNYIDEVVDFGNHFRIDESIIEEYRGQLLVVKTDMQNVKKHYKKIFDACYEAARNNTSVLAQLHPSEEKEPLLRCVVDGDRYVAIDDSEGELYASVPIKEDEDMQVTWNRAVALFSDVYTRYSLVLMRQVELSSRNLSSMESQQDADAVKQKMDIIDSLHNAIQLGKDKLSTIAEEHKLEGALVTKLLTSMDDYMGVVSQMESDYIGGSNDAV